MLNKLFLWFSEITAFPFLFLYFKLKIIGRENLKKIKGPLLIISNHTSYWDAILIHYVIPFRRLFFMTNSLTLNNKIISFILSLYGAYQIDKEDPKLEGVDLSIDKIKKGHIVVMYPEGKIYKELHEFKKGAAIIASETNVDVLPVYVSGKYSFFKRTKITIGNLIKIDSLNIKTDDKIERIDIINDILYTKVAELKEQE